MQLALSKQFGCRLTTDGKEFLFATYEGGDHLVLTALPLDAAQPQRQLTAGTIPGWWWDDESSKAAVGPSGKIAVAGIDRYEAVDLATGASWQGPLTPNSHVLDIAWTPSGAALGILVMRPGTSGMVLELVVVSGEGKRQKVVAGAGSPWVYAGGALTLTDGILLPVFDGSFLVTSNALPDPDFVPRASWDQQRLLIRARF